MQEETAMDEADEDHANNEWEHKLVSIESSGNVNKTVNGVPPVAQPVEKLYHIASSAWVNAWLAFAYASKCSPDPGPCNNQTLLFKDKENACYAPHDGLKLTSRGAGKGDYRHVSEGMWRQICVSYPGSGPAIKVLFKEVGAGKLMFLLYCIVLYCICACIVFVFVSYLYIVFVSYLYIVFVSYLYVFINLLL
jgi:hypothetical protein